VEYRFGPDTTYAMAEDVVPFSETSTIDRWNYSDWTVELILQTDGNLETKAIDASEFKFTGRAVPKSRQNTRWSMLNPRAPPQDICPIIRSA
jgi:hypothetical protein